jgi:integrase
LLRAAEAHLNGKLVPHIAVCLFAGLRPSEASRLGWDKVNFKDKEIRLSATDTKTGRSRIIPLEPTLAAWLRAYQVQPFYKRAQWRDAAQIKQAAGITTWQPDILRHTSISHYFRKTGSYGKTAEFHGNSESIIKAHYQCRVSSAETKQFYALLPTKGGRK